MTDQPRVLHLLSQQPGWTGSGIALDAIVRGAAAKGWNQTAVVGLPQGKSPVQLTQLESRQIRPLFFDTDALPFPLPGMSDVMPYASSRFSQLTADQLAAYRLAWQRHISEVVEDFRPDVIHAHHVWLMSSMIKDIAPQVPVATHCHGTGLRQLALCPTLAREVADGCARNDAFFVLHRGHAEQLTREIDATADKIHTIGSGFRADVFHAIERSTGGAPVIAYAGKLSQAKGVPWLLQAVEQLQNRIPDLTLHVAGSGEGAEADAIRARMAAMDCVVFHGQLNQSDLADLMRRSSLFVLPSFYEGLPLVLVEAAACGCRIVSTQLPGVVDQLLPLLGDAIEAVPLPRLTNTDQPAAEDLPAFVDRLGQAIAASLQRPPLQDPAEATRGLTWSAVFEKIETVWHRLISRV